MTCGEKLARGTGYYRWDPWGLRAWFRGARQQTMQDNLMKHVDMTPGLQNTSYCFPRRANVDLNQIRDSQHTGK